MTFPSPSSMETSAPSAGTGTPLKRAKLEQRYDAIVVGSGMGGLSAAALLAQSAHKRVLVLERHYTAGGFTHEFRRGAYAWDVGLHYVGEVNQPGSQLRAVFDAVTDGKLEWEDLGEVYDRIIIGDDAYDFVKGGDAFRARMLDYFPEERRAIDGYLALVREVARRRDGYYVEKALPRPLAFLLGRWLRRPVLRLARRTTAAVLSELTQNRRLIGVLTGQYMNYGLPPGQSSFFAHATIAGHYLEGAAYPVGGAARIAASIEPVLEQWGGRIVTSAAVSEIVIARGRVQGVRLADETMVNAPIVVSDAGILETLESLVPPSLPQLEPLRKTVGRLEPSIAHACLYVGLNQNAAALGIERKNLWVYPSDNHDGNLRRFFQDPQAPLPVAYVSFPSAKDPDFERRHPGRATAEVIVPVPYDWFAPWQAERWRHRGAAYEALKSALSDRLLNLLLTQLPQLRSAVDHVELSTPVSTRHFTGHVRGQIYGLSATPARFLERALRPATPVGGLFFTGADVAILGVSGALMGGALCASAILRRNVLSGIGARNGR